jgi:tetrahydromethanopterin S-methyltransferase subunit G
MTPEETKRRYEDSNPDRRHCPSHEERCQMHKDLAEDVYMVRDEVMAVRTERKTEKYFYGVIGGVILFILGVFQWVFNDNLSTIREELKTIKAFVSTGSVAVATNQMEINTIKERLDRIEEEIQTRHSR